MDRRNFLKILLFSYYFRKSIFSKSMIPEQKIGTRKIPSSQENIPVIGLGTWQSFGLDPDQRNIQKLATITNRFYELGGRVIDSSPMYGYSEGNIGRIFPYLKHTDLFYATKVWTSGKERGIKQMLSSFQKMNVQKMDLFQIHNLVDWKSHIKTLDKWKQEGNIRYTGLTHYHSGAFSEMESIIKSIKIDFIQIPYSINYRFAENRLLKLAKDMSIAVLVNRPFDGGSLFKRINKKKLPDYLLSGGIHSWAQLFLKYIISNDAVTCVIPGTNKLHHLEDNMQAGYGELPDKKEREKWINLFKL